MVKFQWPIVRGKRKPSTLAEAQTSHQLRTEAGFTKIKSTEDLASRIKFTDDFFSNVINNILDQINVILKKDTLSPKDERKLEILNGYLVNFEAYRAVKKAGMAWSVAGEDRDMSKRYRAFETYFTRNWRDPWETKKILRFAMYLEDISYRDPHVIPADTIIVQSQPTQGWPTVRLDDLLERKRKEENE